MNLGIAAEVVCGTTSSGTSPTNDALEDPDPTVDDRLVEEHVGSSAVTGTGVDLSLFVASAQHVAGDGDRKATFPVDPLALGGRDHGYDGLT